MRRRVAELAARREALIARSGELRERLAEYGGELAYSVGRFDRAFSVVRSVATPPVLLAAAAGLLIVVRPRRLIQWVGRGLVIGSMLKKVGGLLGRRHEEHERREMREAALDRYP